MDDTGQAKSNEVNRLQELVQGFSLDQLRFLAVRPYLRSDREAARAIGRAAETVCRWENKADVDEAVRLMLTDGVVVAGEIMRRALPKAASEIVDELGHKQVAIRHKAAVEVLDRGGVVGVQKHEVSGKDGGAIEVSNTLTIYEYPG